MSGLAVVVGPFSEVMDMPFQKAVKYGAKLRLALAGPSGSGKTYTALTLACALAGGKPVAVIDTERGSASKYALTKDGQGFEFDVQELTNYNPQHYINAIHEAEQGGYAVLVIDSLTHAWNSVGGVLEIVDNAAKRTQSKNTFNAWGEGTKIQNQLIDTVTRSPLHIIVTMRSKTEYVLEQVNGKSTPRKVGMAPVQRADIEYEFDVYAEMTIENTMIVQKSRCSDLSGQVIEKPGPEVAAALDAWLAGEPSPERTIAPVQDDTPVSEQQAASLTKLCQYLKKQVPQPANYQEAKQLIADLSLEYRQSRNKTA